MSSLPPMWGIPPWGGDPNAPPPPYIPTTVPYVGNVTPPSNDTYTQVWKDLLLLRPELGPARARQFIKHSFRQLAERRRWSWLMGHGQFSLPPIVNTGTVNLLPGSSIVTGNITPWDPSIVGRQFRINLTSPIFTVTQLFQSNVLAIDRPWPLAPQMDTGYQIYNAYFTVPADFQKFVSVLDPQMSWSLWLDKTPEQIDLSDPQRSNTGQSWAITFRDYSPGSNGRINTPAQISGPGSALPLVTGDSIYVAPTSAYFIITITYPGYPGEAQFTWFKNSGRVQGAFTVDATQPMSLQDGISIIWPGQQTWQLGDMFLIEALPGTQAGAPRYEFWPHNLTSPYVYTFQYERRVVDLDQPNTVLPTTVRGDVLLEMGLAKASRWRGTTDQPNPGYDIQLALVHEARSDKMIYELERQDDEINPIDISYVQGMRQAPFVADSRWLQSHAI